MRISLIGAGRLAAHLGRALQALGQTPVSLGARDPARAAPLAQALGLQARPPEQALDADWVFLCVRDEAIAPLAARLQWQQQLAVHCSGATALDALAPAARRAGFHPLQLFAEPLPAPEAALAAFRGIGIGIEADEPLPFQQLARQLGATPLALDGGQRLRYHAAANLAASALFAPLQLASQLAGQALGLSAEQAWQQLQPLAAGSLRAAAERGLAGALSGPVARGDAAVLAAQLHALQDLQPEAAALYRQLMQALLPLAERSGRLPAADLQRLRDVLRA